MANGQSPRHRGTSTLVTLLAGAGALVTAPAYAGDALSCGQKDQKVRQLLLAAADIDKTADQMESDRQSAGVYAMLGAYGEQIRMAKGVVDGACATAGAAISQLRSSCRAWEAGASIGQSINLGVAVTTAPGSTNTLMAACSKTSAKGACSAGQGLAKAHDGDAVGAAFDTVKGSAELVDAAGKVGDKPMAVPGAKATARVVGAASDVYHGEKNTTAIAEEAASRDMMLRSAVADARLRAGSLRLIALELRKRSCTEAEPLIKVDFSREIAASKSTGGPKPDAHAIDVGQFSRDMNKWRNDEAARKAEEERLAAAQRQRERERAQALAEAEAAQRQESSDGGLFEALLQGFLIGGAAAIANKSAAPAYSPPPDASTSTTGGRMSSTPTRSIEYNCNAYIGQNVKDPRCSGQ